MDREIADWVSIGISGKIGWFPDAMSLGIIKDDKIIAGIVYADLREYVDNRPHCCSMSIYSVDKRWATRHNLKELFSFPFIEFGLERVQTVCSANEGEIMSFNKRLGFKQEGVHREAWPLGGNSVSFGMLRDDCKWL